MNKKTKIQFMICFLVPLAVVIEEIIKIMNNQNKSVLTYIFIIVYINLAIGILFAMKIIWKGKQNTKKEVSKFYKVISPAAFIIYFLLGALLILLAFVVVFIATYYFLSLLLTFIPIIKLENQMCLVFLSSLCGLCVLSYWDERIMKYLVNKMQLSKKDSIKIYQLGIDSIRFVNPRKLMYFLTIFFYIIVYLIDLNGGSVVGLEWWKDISKFAEAILITFVAIDTYVEQIKPKLTRYKLCR